MKNPTLQIGDVIDFSGETLTVSCIEGDWATWRHPKSGKRYARCNVHDYGNIRILRRAGKLIHESEVR
jgi:hypothetical protein